MVRFMGPKYDLWSYDLNGDRSKKKSWFADFYPSFFVMILILWFDDPVVKTQIPKIWERRYSMIQLSDDSNFDDPLIKLYLWSSVYEFLQMCTNYSEANFRYFKIVFISALPIALCHLSKVLWCDLADLA